MILRQKTKENGKSQKRIIFCKLTATSQDKLKTMFRESQIRVIFHG